MCDDDMPQKEGRKPEKPETIEVSHEGFVVLSGDTWWQRMMVVSGSQSASLGMTTSDMRKIGKSLIKRAKRAEARVEERRKRRR